MSAHPKATKRGSRLWIRLLVFALLVAGFFLFMRSLAKKETPKDAARALTAEQMTWLDLMEVPGALRAVLWGDADSGAYGAWNKWPPGTDARAFTQSADLKIVVMSGTLVYSLENEPPGEFSAGSYLFVPAGKVRSLKCKEGRDCIFFTEQSGAFDFQGVLPPKK